MVGYLGNAFSECKTRQIYSLDRLFNGIVTHLNLLPRLLILFWLLRRSLGKIKPNGANFPKRRFNITGVLLRQRGYGLLPSCETQFTGVLAPIK